MNFTKILKKIPSLSLSMSSPLISTSCSIFILLLFASLQLTQPSSPIENEEIISLAKNVNVKKDHSKIQIDLWRPKRYVKLKPTESVTPPIKKKKHKLRLSKSKSNSSRITNLKPKPKQKILQNKKHTANNLNSSTKTNKTKKSKINMNISRIGQSSSFQQRKSRHRHRRSKKGNPGFSGGNSVLDEDSTTKPDSVTNDSDPDPDPYEATDDTSETDPNENSTEETDEEDTTETKNENDDGNENEDNKKEKETENEEDADYSNAEDSLSSDVDEPKNPEDTAVYGVCNILYPCVAHEINYINITPNLDLDSLDDVERQEKQEEGSCYKEPWENPPGEPIHRIVCYDHDPPATDFPDKPEITLISRKTPKDLNDGFDGVGFAIPEKKVYRYSRFFDLDGVADQYKDEDGELEFEYMDWPGPTVQDYMKQRQEDQTIMFSELGAVKPCLQMLDFQGRATKYLDYLCNEVEGLDITVLGIPGAGESVSGGIGGGGNIGPGSGSGPGIGPGSGIGGGGNPGAGGLRSELKLETEPKIRRKKRQVSQTTESDVEDSTDENPADDALEIDDSTDPTKNENEDSTDANVDVDVDIDDDVDGNGTRKSFSKEEDSDETEKGEEEEHSGHAHSHPRKKTGNVELCHKNLVTPIDEPFNPYVNLRCNRPKNRDKSDKKCIDWPLPPGRIYFASGNDSMLVTFVQPLLIDETILTRLAHDPNDPKLPKLEPKLECSELFSKDIRTVLDFAFASNRLILGMKCGVVIIKDINTKQVGFDIAYLSSSDRVRAQPDQPSYHNFPYMINVVASTPCCSTNKMCRHLKPIVAIYSSYANWISFPTDYDRHALTYIYVSMNNGDTFDRKVMASQNTASNLIYWMYSKIPKYRQKDVRPPRWVVRQWEKSKLGEAMSFDSIAVDPVTKLILQKKTGTATYNETDCDELISINAVSEENLLLVLCRDRDEPPKTRSGKTWSTNSYQIFTVPVAESIPLMVMQKRSKRKFSCEPMTDAANPKLTILPSLIRIPNSYSIFIIGCKNIIYTSSNGGKTIFAATFYYNETEKANTTHSNYLLSYKNKFLDQYPIIAIDPKGQLVMMTFGKYFAYGVIASKSETRLICGPILDKLPKEIKGPLSKPVFIPYFDDAGAVGVSVIYIQLLKNSKKDFYEENYKDRYAIRLLDSLISIHSHALPFYTEYPDIVSGAKSKTLSPCTTYFFKTNVTTISMDVGETQAVHVSVQNDVNELPLNVVLTHDKAASIVVQAMTPRKHDIILKAEPSAIPREIAQINAFFGSQYANLEAVSSHLILSTDPQMRCHVQPKEHVTVRFGCSKYMVAHEDERRLQCKLFRDNFQYTIPTGHFDEDMARLWVRERPQFYRIENGTLNITYDYEMFGCPVEPYRLEDYVPDLRLLPVGTKNTTEGEKFKGNFVLIEIFGASGYTYTRNFKETDCIRAPPQTLEKMIADWKVRVEAARAAYVDYPFFDFEAIYQPINIWNRVNYKSCEGTQFVDEEDEEATSEADDDPDASNYDEVEEEEPTREEQKKNLEEDKEYAHTKYDGPYEIMNNELPEDQRNKLKFDPYIRQRVYIFLAVAVDPYDSFCNYHTYFGLSLAVPKEESDYILILIFIGTLLFLLFLIILGYYIQRYRVHRHHYKEALYNRLLTAAWNLSFRYEKLLSDSKITEPVVKQQLVATKKLKFQKHSGVPASSDTKPKAGLRGLRHRLRQ